MPKRRKYGHIYFCNPSQPGEKTSRWIHVTVLQVCNDVRKYSEADLYKQLSYFCHILDTERCLDKVDSRIKVQVDREITRIRHVVESAASIVRNIRDRCGHGWVQMRDLFVL
ncbi:hypothetical protein MLD38_040455 [Melastoma candidum]|nr:hypothetical protein MLD38_040455 [Melastoma candidum]